MMNFLIGLAAIGSFLSLCWLVGDESSGNRVFHGFCILVVIFVSVAFTWYVGALLSMAFGLSSFWS